MGTNRRYKRKVHKAERSNRVGLFGIFIIVAALAIVTGTKGRSLKERDLAYQQREQALDKQIEEEESRAIALEERRIYVQTKQYIEEVAKEKLGLVNPNEIILKPSNE